MYRSFIAAAVLAATAAPAFADTSVTINVAGLDAASVHARIYEAALVACRAELANWSATVQFYNHPICMRDAIARAEADYDARSDAAPR
jgi:hypothetical protein